MSPAPHPCLGDAFEKVKLIGAWRWMLLAQFAIDRAGLPFVVGLSPKRADDFRTEDPGGPR